MGLRSREKDVASVVPMQCRRGSELCQESVDYFSMNRSSLLCLLRHCSAEVQMPFLFSFWRHLPRPEWCRLTSCRWVLKLKVWVATLSRQFQEVLAVFSWTDFFKSRYSVPSAGQGSRVAVCVKLSNIREHQR